MDIDETQDRWDHDMTQAQYDALKALCKRYDAPFNPADFSPATYDLPEGYVCGMVGGRIYVGCSPEGRIAT